MRRLSIILVLLFVAGCGVAIKTTEVPWDFQERVVQNPKVRIAVGDYYHDDIHRNAWGMPGTFTGRLKTHLGKCVANAVQMKLPGAEVKVVPIKDVLSSPANIHIYDLKLKDYTFFGFLFELKGKIKTERKVYNIKGLKHRFGFTESPYDLEVGKKALLDVCNQFAERLEEILRKEGLY